MSIKPPQPITAPPPRPLPRWTSQQLFGSQAVVEIVHQQQVYVLRQTAQGKLILTK